MWMWVQKILVDATEAAKLENRKLIISLLERNGSGKVLDLGCGDGSFTKEIGEKIGTKQVYGIEVEEELVRLCERNRVRVYKSDLNTTLPIDNEYFDVITSNQVLEHIWHTDLFIEEIYRVLNPGGYTIISTPNLTAWENVLSIILGYQLFATGASDEVNLGNPLSPDHKRKTYGGLYDAHHRVFTYQGLKELLEYHGFQVERIIGAGYLPFPIKIARLISRVDPRHARFIIVKARKI